MNNDLGKRIEAIRLSKGMNKTEFGKLFGASGSLVNKWENHGITPSEERMKQIQKISDYDSVDELLYGSADKQITNILLEEFGAKANPKYINEIIEYNNETNGYVALNKDNLIDFYYSFEKLDQTKEERQDYIKNILKNNNDQILLAQSEIENDLIYEMVSDDILKMDLDNENESYVLLLASVFGLLENRENEYRLIDSLMELIVVLYASDHNDIESKEVILDRKYNSLKREFIKAEKKLMG